MKSSHSRAVVLLDLVEIGGAKPVQGRAEPVLEGARDRRSSR